MEQRYSLAHHVRSHQCTVSIVVLEEWNQRCSDRGNLLWRYIHEVDICRWNYWEVGILTALYNRTDKCTIIIQRCITLTDDVLSLFLSCQIYDTVVAQISYTIFYLTVRSLDESELINLSIYTQR